VKDRIPWNPLSKLDSLQKSGVAIGCGFDIHALMILYHLKLAWRFHVAAMNTSVAYAKTKKKKKKKKKKKTHFIILVYGSNTFNAVHHTWKTSRTKKLHFKSFI
jgi:hypothetical protein